MTDKIENIDVHFFQIVFSLQTAAMQQMGKIVSPVTGKIERDLEIARTTIDILGMMEKKMKGNLTPQEARYIGHSLHELRLNFVDESKKGDSEKGTPKAEPDRSENEKKPNGQDQ
jgi:hypothetical protein